MMTSRLMPCEASHACSTSALSRQVGSSRRSTPITPRAASGLSRGGRGTLALRPWRFRRYLIKRAAMAAHSAPRRTAGLSRRADLVRSFIGWSWGDRRAGTQLQGVAGLEGSVDLDRVGLHREGCGVRAERGHGAARVAPVVGLLHRGAHRPGAQGGEPEDSALVERARHRRHKGPFAGRTGQLLGSFHHGQGGGLYALAVGVSLDEREGHGVVAKAALVEELAQMGMPRTSIHTMACAMVLAW